MRIHPTPLALGFLLLALVPGCGGNIAQVSSAPKYVCQPGGGALQAEIPSHKIAFRCGGRALCGAKYIPVRIVNCSQGPLSPKSMRHTNLTTGKPPRYKRIIIFSFENKTLQQGESFIRRVPLLLRKETARIKLIVTSQRGKKLRWLSREIKTYNVVEQACRRDGGLWNENGRYCNRKTTDKGKVCFDGSECQGACVHTGFVLTQRGPCSSTPGTRLAQTPMGYRVGRCASHRYLRSHEKRYLSSTKTQRKPESLCRIGVRKHTPGCVVRRLYYLDPLRHHKKMFVTHLPPYHKGPALTP